MALPTSTRIQVEIEPLDAASEVLDRSKDEGELLAELKQAVKRAGLCTKPLLAMTDGPSLEEDSDATDPGEDFESDDLEGQRFRMHPKHIRCKFSIRNTVTPKMDDITDEGDKNTFQEERSEDVMLPVNRGPGALLREEKKFQAVPPTPRSSSETASFAFNDSLFTQGVPLHHVFPARTSQFLPPNIYPNGSSGIGNHVPFPPHPPLIDYNLFASFPPRMVQLTSDDQGVPNIGSEMQEHRSPFSSSSGSPERPPVMTNVFPPFPSFNANHDRSLQSTIYNTAFPLPMFPHIHNDVSCIPRAFPWFVQPENLISPPRVPEETADMSSVGSIPPGMCILSPPLPLPWPEMLGSAPQLLNPETSEHELDEQDISHLTLQTKGNTSANCCKPQKTSSGIKQKRIRVTFTEEQKEMLKQRFAENDKLDIYERQKLASQLGITQRQVLVWFQNQRAKLRERRSKLEATSGLQSFDATAILQQMLQNAQQNADLF